MGGRFRPWTTTEERALKELTAEGKTSAVVGEILNRSPEAIRRHRTKLKVRVPRKHAQTDMTMMWIQRDMLLAFQRKAREAGLHRVEYVRRVLAKHLELVL